MGTDNCKSFFLYVACNCPHQAIIPLAAGPGYPGEQFHTFHIRDEILEIRPFYRAGKGNMGAFFTRKCLQEPPDLGDPNNLMRKVLIFRRIGLPFHQKKIGCLPVPPQGLSQRERQASATSDDADPHGVCVIPDDRIHALFPH